MEQLELLNAENLTYRVKFISIVQKLSPLSTEELTSYYDKLIDGNSVIVPLFSNDRVILNDFVLELIKINVSIGNCTFHEENE